MRLSEVGEDVERRTKMGNRPVQERRRRKDHRVTRLIMVRSRRNQPTFRKFPPRSFYKRGSPLIKCFRSQKTQNYDLTLL